MGSVTIAPGEYHLSFLLSENGIFIFEIAVSAVIYNVGERNFHSQLANFIGVHPITKIFTKNTVKVPRPLFE